MPDLRHKATVQFSSGENPPPKPEKYGVFGLIPDRKPRKAAQSGAATARLRCFGLQNGATLGFLQPRRVRANQTKGTFDLTSGGLYAEPDEDQELSGRA